MMLYLISKPIQELRLVGARIALIIFWIFFFNFTFFLNESCMTIDLYNIELFLKCQRKINDINK